MALDSDKLRRAEREVLDRPDVAVICSAVSLWELRLKWSTIDIRGDRKGPVAPEDALEMIEANGWAILPLTPAHAVKRLDTPLGHSDPFDELLLVQAQVEGLRLLTRDPLLRQHPLAYVP